MMKVAFLGLGAMGSRMAHRLQDAGFDLTVWNRTPEAVKVFAASGARVADHPADATCGADIVISMVRDDAASEAVWLQPETGAIHKLKAGAVAIEASTVTSIWVRHLGQRVRDAGAEFLDAPVAGSRPQAEAGQLIFMAGGSPDALDKARPVLDAMGGAVHHAGDIGAGAAVKLMVNGLFGMQIALIAELIGLCERIGVAPETAVEIIGNTPVCSPAAKAGAQAMLAGQWAPAFPIALVAKDFGLIGTVAEQAEASVPLSRATGEIFGRGVQHGLGADNITGIAQLYVNERTKRSP